MDRRDRGGRVMDEKAEQPRRRPSIEVRCPKCGRARCGTGCPGPATCAAGAGTRSATSSGTRPRGCAVDAGPNRGLPAGAAGGARRRPHGAARVHGARRGAGGVTGDNKRILGARRAGWARRVSSTGPSYGAAPSLLATRARHCRPWEATGPTYSRPRRRRTPARGRRGPRSARPTAPHTPAPRSGRTAPWTAPRAAWRPPARYRQGSGPCRRPPPAPPPSRAPRSSTPRGCCCARAARP